MTPKQISYKNPLRTRDLFSYFAFVIIISTVLITVNASQRVGGYYFLALKGTLTLLVGVGAVLLLQAVETRQSLARQLRRPLFGFLLIASLFMKAAMLRLERGWSAVVFNQAPVSLARDGNRLQFGYHDATGTLQKANLHADLSMHFIPWGDAYADRITSALREDQALSRQTVVTLEPWPWALINLNSWDEQQHQRLKSTLLRDIAAGQHDQPLLSSLGRLSADRSQVVLVRLMHEMEIKQRYPWWSSSPDDYIRAYRHVVSLARANGMHNLRWIWSPAGDRQAQGFWPGEDVVDYVGLSIFATPKWNPQPTSPDKTPGGNAHFRVLLRQRYWVQQYGKPIILAEVGINDTTENRLRWFRESIQDLASMPEVVAWIYFNQPQPDIVDLNIELPDWSLSGVEAEGLKQLLRATAP